MRYTKPYVDKHSRQPAESLSKYFELGEKTVYPWLGESMPFLIALCQVRNPHDNLVRNTVREIPSSIFVFSI